MAVYPQLVTGALSQFPIVKQRRARTVVNSAADGSSIKLADAAGGNLEWQLQYNALADSELAALQQFFTAMEGSLNAFTFVDPSANLLTWSEELNNAAWQADPLLRLTGGVTDPMGGTGAWLLSNSGAGPQGLTQTLNAPRVYTYCFSVYAQAAQTTPITLVVGSLSVTQTAGPAWSRLALTAVGDASADVVVFAVQTPAGSAVSLFGPQAEAQAAASVYKTSSSGGVYANARFRDDAFSFTTTDVNHHSTVVNIFYADNL
jgi:hypothetical protein